MSWGVSGVTAAAVHRRGRPPLLPDDYYRVVIAPVYPNVKTRRHQQNLYYLLLAFEAIRDDPELVAYYMAEERHSVSIMAQLGRFRDPDTIRQVAREVMATCQGWRVRDVEKALRSLRRRIYETASEMRR